MSTSNRQHPSDMTSRPPVAGWLLGVVLGLGFSWVPCRWIHHATANSRALMPAFEAMAAGEPEVANKLLKEAESRVVFDRLLERPELGEGIRGLGTKVPELFSARSATDSEER